MPPIPELDVAAALLDEAVDALLAGDHERACERLRRADIPAVHSFAARIMGAWDPGIHRRRRVERPTGIAKSPVRKPSGSLEASIFARDGWRRCYCGVRVVTPQARKVLVDMFPDVVRWGSKNDDRHAAFFALSAVADHVVPHALGGSNGADNLVTTCQSCNYGKGDRLLAEVGLIDRRFRVSVIDGWDGLSRLSLGRKIVPTIVRAATEQPGSTIAKLPRTLSYDAWFSALDHENPGISVRLLGFLTDCEALGVSWRLKDYLVIRLTVGHQVVWICGIAPNGEVDVPWHIGDHKDSFRAFAFTIAAALPKAHVHESSRQWILKKDRNTKLHIVDLVDISTDFRNALCVVAADIANS